VNDGPRLKDFGAQLKMLFPESTTQKEIDFLPLTYGGTTFIGLLTRLFGEGVDRSREGLKTRRYIYQALKGDEPVGVAHGSDFILGSNKVDVFVFYTAGGTIKEVRVNGLPSSVEDTLKKGGFLTQFIGHTTAEFEIIRGKRGRIRSRGAFLSLVKKPTDAQSRPYFEKLYRSVRYNCAFMDVAFFITRHPDLADKSNQAFPSEVEVSSGKSSTGPEAFVNAQVNHDPMSGKPIADEDDGDEADEGADETTGGEEVAPPPRS
jgi:hypothetical protein